MDKVDSNEVAYYAAKNADKVAGEERDPNTGKRMLGITSKNPATPTFGDRILSMAEESEERRVASNHDYNTGLLNRKGLLEEYTLVKGTKQRFEANLAPEEMTKDDAMISLDLIGLKKINTEMGEINGDKLIKRAAEYLKLCVGKTDLVSRWSGDEFLVVLIGSSEEDTKGVVDKINGSLPARTRFNIGYKQLSETADTEKEFMMMMNRVERIKKLGPTDETGRSVGNGVVAKINENWDIEKVS